MAEKKAILSEEVTVNDLKERLHSAIQCAQMVEKDLEESRNTNNILQADLAKMQKKNAVLASDLSVLTNLYS